MRSDSRHFWLERLKLNILSSKKEGQDGFKCKQFLVRILRSKCFPCVTINYPNITRLILTWYRLVLSWAYQNVSIVDQYCQQYALQKSAIEVLLLLFAEETKLSRDSHEPTIFQSKVWNWERATVIQFYNGQRVELRMRSHAAQGRCNFLKEDILLSRYLPLPLRE